VVSFFRRKQKSNTFQLCVYALSLSSFWCSADVGAMELVFVDLIALDRNIKQEETTNLESSDFIPRATLFYSN